MWEYVCFLISKAEHLYIMPRLLEATACRSIFVWISFPLAMLSESVENGIDSGQGSIFFCVGGKVKNEFRDISCVLVSTYNAMLEKSGIHKTFESPLYSSFHILCSNQTKSSLSS
jgi:hypothetical protein